MNSAEGTETAGVLATDAGLFALWDPAAFAMVVDYDSWEEQLCEDEDVVRHIHAGALVPVNIDSDGAFQFLVRVGSPGRPAELTDRERTYVLVSSAAYEFRSSGDAVLSGIEDVDADGADALTIALPAGTWSVTVHLVDWAAEPGGRTPDGQPAETALPDFVLLVDPAGDSPGTYRRSIQTFDQ